jgi:broad specificity phosphatase PhoE
MKWVFKSIVSLFLIIFLIGAGIVFTYKIESLIITEIFVMRHGKTDKNKNHNLVFGQQDLPLNEKGKEEINLIAKALPIKNAILYTSPQRRAFETADIIALTTHSIVKIDNRLRERDFKREFRESKENQLGRVLDFFYEKLNYRTDTLWVITHGGIIGGLLSHTGMVEKIPIKNGGIFIFKYNKLTKKLSFSETVVCYRCLNEEFKTGKLLTKIFI